MINAKARTKTHFQKVRRKAEQGTVKSLGHAAALTRKVARSKIRRSKKPAKPGRPFRTRRGQAKRAILYDVDKGKTVAVIGPSAHLISDIASKHEHGGTEQPKKKKQRPPNWRLEIGGHGPVATPGGTAYVKIRTQRQLKRAETQARRIRRNRGDPANVRKVGRKKPGPVTYRKRPVMRPTLETVSKRLPKFWAGSVKK